MVNMLEIKMANGEYDSNTPMKEIAREAFAMYAHVENLVVSVREHAGWYLSWAMVDGEMVVVETANDSARMSAAARKFYARVANMELNYLPAVDRNAVCV